MQFTTQLLNVSSVANGTMRYTMAPMDMKAVVEEVAAAEKERADKKGLALTVEIAPGSYQMTGDAVQLREVVKNLVGNAIIYTPSGSVTVSLSRNAGRLVLAVKDTGVGLTPEDKAKLFTEGGRGEEAFKINPESTGYGLSFVKGVVAAHYGTVRAESEGRGKGAVFVVEMAVGIIDENHIYL